MLGSISRLCSVAGIALLIIYSPARAVITDINGIQIEERKFNDFPDSDLTVTSNFPTEVTFDESNFGEPDPFGSFFANMHVGWFSADGGTTAFELVNQMAFDISFDLTLDAASASPRKEAGFRFDTFIAGEGQFIVTSDGEVAAFGANLPFHTFGNDVYTLGDTASMRIIYRPGDGEGGSIPATMEYFYNGESSGALAMENLENGIIDDSNVGVYGQYAVSQSNPNDFGISTFENFVIAEPVIVAGDLNGDGVADALDIEYLWDNSVDLTGDEQTDITDVVELVQALFETCMGDANLDGEVNEADLAWVADGWKLTPGGEDPYSWATGDFNNDDLINEADLAWLADNWKQPCPPPTEPTAVPEPAAIVLLLGGALIRMRRPG